MSRVIERTQSKFPIILAHDDLSDNYVAAFSQAAELTDLKVRSLLFGERANVRYQTIDIIGR